ncbi:NUDIX hydrolase [Patescibacteria group bacterium]|nr:NUDIX hydrolase [Patescibacteria group bacterium]
MILQVGVKAFLRNKDGEYLLIKRSPEKYPDVKDFWDIVGGRIDPGTNLMENLAREVREETGLVITSEPRLIAAQDIIPNAEKHVVRLTYVADASGEVVLDKKENTEYKWLTLSKLKSQAHLDKYAKAVLEENRLG